MGIIDVSELRNLETGDAVFLEMRTSAWPEMACFSGWALFKECIPVMYMDEAEQETHDFMYRFSAVRREHHTVVNFDIMPLQLNVYGNEWRAWTGRPDDAEREEEKWE